MRVVPLGHAPSPPRRPTPHPPRATRTRPVSPDETHRLSFVLLWLWASPALSPRRSASISLQYRRVQCVAGFGSPRRASAVATAELAFSSLRRGVVTTSCAVGARSVCARRGWFPPRPHRLVGAVERRALCPLLSAVAHAVLPIVKRDGPLWLPSREPVVGRVGSRHSRRRLNDAWGCRGVFLLCPTSTARTVKYRS